MTIGRSDVGPGARRQKQNQLTREPAGKFDSLIEAPIGRHSQKSHQRPFMFASEPSEILDRLQSAGLDVVPDDAMAEHGCDAPTLKRQGLYPCEAEIARRLSQSEKHWRRIAPQLERQGLPKIDPVMKGRFWPAVEAFFRNRHGLGNMVATQPDGEERWDVP